MVQQGFPFGPVIEYKHKGAFISESTYSLLESGSFNRVPILMGVTSDESVFFEKCRYFFKLISNIHFLLLDG